MELKKRATLSLAMIVKNEANTLIPCLDSVGGVVDEIVVLVDDSTTDNSFEIAKKYTDKVEYYKWEDDFAGARNLAISKCTKDFIMIMDGHEILHPKSKQIVEELMQRVIEGKDLFTTGEFSAMIYMNPTGDTLENLIPQTIFYQPRLFRNNGKYKYIGRVHNYIVQDKDCALLKRPVPYLVFIHKRTEENADNRKKQRAEMNVKLLLKDIEDNPEVPRAYFYLAQTYHEMGETDKSAEWYEKYIKISEWPKEKAHALLILGTIYGIKKEYDKAWDYALEALKNDWERPEPYLLLGDIAFEQAQNNPNKYYEAEHWYKAACDMKVPEVPAMFMRGDAFTYLPYAKMAILYSHVGEYYKALQAAEKAIELGYHDNGTIDIEQKMPIWKDKLMLKENVKNISIYDENDTFTFLQELQIKLMDKYNLAVGNMPEDSQMKWSDVVWIEWCAKNVLKLSTMPKKPGQLWIVRLHGYELFSPKRIQQIAWDKIDVLMFVAEHVKKHFNELYMIPEKVKQIVVPNGINLKKWSYANRGNMKRVNKIGCVGILTEKKGPQLLGSVIQYFAKHYPSFKFLLRFDIIEHPNMSERTLLHMIKDCDNWEMVPRQESLNSWMENIDYLISTSTLESFSYVIGEAMAKGIKPLIYNWEGATDIWPKELIWTDINELRKLIETDIYNSPMYRQWVEDHYSVEKQYETVVKLIEGEI